MNRTIVAAALLSAITAAPAMAQTNITPASKFCWGENVGFINFRDCGTPVGSQGVRISPLILSGYAWGENIGYINFGDGAPDFGPAYSNPTSGFVAFPDFGVNRDFATGNLSGYAWGENVGWINFSGGAAANPPNPARYDVAANGGGRLRGYAWGENIGWINLDDASIFVAAACPADFNADGFVTVADIFYFLSAWFAGNPAANFNANATVEVADIFAFLSAWFAGC